MLPNVIRILCECLGSGLIIQCLRYPTENIRCLFLEGLGSNPTSKDLVSLLYVHFKCSSYKAFVSLVELLLTDVKLDKKQFKSYSEVCLKIIALNQRKSIFILNPQMSSHQLIYLSANECVKNQLEKVFNFYNFH